MPFWIQVDPPLAGYEMRHFIAKTAGSQAIVYNILSQPIKTIP